MENCFLLFIVANILVFVNSFPVDLKEVINNNKCNFPPVYLASDERYATQFQPCSSPEGVLADICANITLESSLCDIAAISRLPVSNVTWELFKETERKEEHLTKICGYMTTFPWTAEECQRTCTESFLICDLYVAMDKVLRRFFEMEVKDYTCLHDFIHSGKLSFLFPYPPRGALDNADLLQKCGTPTEDETVKQLCNVMTEVAVSFLKNRVSAKFHEDLTVRNVTSEWDPCRGMSAFSTFSTSVNFRSLTDLENCNKLCTSHTGICKTIYLGLEKYQLATAGRSSFTGSAQSPIGTLTESKQPGQQSEQQPAGTITRPGQPAETITGSEQQTGTIAGPEQQAQQQTGVIAQPAQQQAGVIAQPAQQQTGIIAQPAQQQTGIIAESGQPAQLQAGTITESGQPAQPQAGTITESGQPAQPQTGTITGSGQPAQPQTGTITESGQPAQPQAETITGSGQPAQPQAGTITGSGQPAQPQAGTITGSGQPAQPQAGTISESGQPAQPQVGTISESGQPAQPQAATITKSGQPAQPQAGTVTESGQPAQPQAGTVSVSGQPGQQQTQDGRVTTTDKPSESADLNKKPEQTKLDNSVGYAADDEESSGGHFMAYFLVFIVLSIAGYIIFHNKQKIIALVIEGKTGKGGRRPNTKDYNQLKTEDVMPSLEKSAYSKDYVF